MKKKIKWIALFISFVVVAAAAAYPIFAWFFQYQKSALFVTGDASISVKGWYKVATIDESEQGIVAFDEVEDALTDLNLKELANNQFLAFKFEITNNSERDAFVSLRFSPFADATFDKFLDFFNFVKTNGFSNNNGVNNLPAALNDSISQLAGANTAKFGFKIENRYYWSGTEAPKAYIGDNDTWLWGYSDGKLVIENVLAKGMPAGERGKPVYLYFTLTKNQSSIAIDDYKKWLCGYGNEVGYGQERCARLVDSGYTWEGLPLQSKNIVDQYLLFFIEKELKSISHGEEDLSELNLDIKYFEFIGKSGAA